jgi:hypothetical protein
MSTPLLADVRINVKVRISALWGSLMFCYIYCDYFELYQPGKLSRMWEGRMGPLATSQGALFGAALLMAIPSVMVFLSLALRARANRIVNVILGAVYSAIMLAIVVTPGIWAYYRFMGVLETALSVLIVWEAWTWPKQSSLAR